MISSNLPGNSTNRYMSAINPYRRRDGDSDDDDETEHTEYTEYTDFDVPATPIQSSRRRQSKNLISPSELESEDGWSEGDTSSSSVAANEDSKLLHVNNDDATETSEIGDGDVSISNSEVFLYKYDQQKQATAADEKADNSDPSVAETRIQFLSKIGSQRKMTVFDTTSNHDSTTSFSSQHSIESMHLLSNVSTAEISNNSFQKSKPTHFDAYLADDNESVSENPASPMSLRQSIDIVSPLVKQRHPGDNCSTLNLGNLSGPKKPSRAPPSISEQSSCVKNPNGTFFDKASAAQLKLSSSSANLSSKNFHISNGEKNIESIDKNNIKLSKVHSCDDESTSEHDPYDSALSLTQISQSSSSKILDIATTIARESNRQKEKIKQGRQRRDDYRMQGEQEQQSRQHQQLLQEQQPEQVHKKQKQQQENQAVQDEQDTQVNHQNQDPSPQKQLQPQDQQQSHDNMPIVPPSVFVPGEDDDDMTRMSHILRRAEASGDSKDFSLSNYGSADGRGTNRQSILEGSNDTKSSSLINYDSRISDLDASGFQSSSSRFFDHHDQQQQWEEKQEQQLHQEQEITKDHRQNEMEQQSGRQMIPKQKKSDRRNKFLRSLSFDSRYESPWVANKPGILATQALLPMVTPSQSVAATTGSDETFKVPKALLYEDLVLTPDTPDTWGVSGTFNMLFNNQQQTHYPANNTHRDLKSSEALLSIPEKISTTNRDKKRRGDGSEERSNTSRQSSMQSSKQSTTCRSPLSKQKAQSSPRSQQMESNQQQQKQQHHQPDPLKLSISSKQSRKLKKEESRRRVSEPLPDDMEDSNIGTMIVVPSDFDPYSIISPHVDDRRDFMAKQKSVPAFRRFSTGVNIRYDPSFGLSPHETAISNKVPKLVLPQAQESFMVPKQGRRLSTGMQAVRPLNGNSDSEMPPSFARESSLDYQIEEKEPFDQLIRPPHRKVSGKSLSELPVVNLPSLNIRQAGPASNTEQVANAFSSVISRTGSNEVDSSDDEYEYANMTSPPQPPPRRPTRIEEASVASVRKSATKTNNDPVANVFSGVMSRTGSTEGDPLDDDYDYIDGASPPQPPARRPTRIESISFSPSEGNEYAENLAAKMEGKKERSRISLQLKGSNNNNDNDLVSFYYMNHKLDRRMIIVLCILLAVTLLVLGGVAGSLITILLYDSEKGNEGTTDQHDGMPLVQVVSTENPSLVLTLPPTTLKTRQLLRGFNHQ